MHNTIPYKNYLLTVFLCVMFFGLKAQIPASIFDLKQFKNRVEQKNDTLYVVNFWATWCKPCVAELPYFQSMINLYKNQPVKVILVSQDAKTKALPVSQFMQNFNFTAEFFILSAGNPNIWIDQIEPKWSGIIPATVLYKNGIALDFHEGDFPSEKTLEDFIHSKL